MIEFVLGFLLGLIACACGYGVYRVRGGQPW